MFRSHALGTAALLIAVGCAPSLREVPEARPEAAVSRKLRKVDAAVEEMVAARKLAGAVILVAKDGQVVFSGTYGKMDLDAGTRCGPTPSSGSIR
jgi:CubicO group peptidase (beta-lactamase class C family)